MGDRLGTPSAVPFFGKQTEQFYFKNTAVLKDRFVVQKIKNETFPKLENFLSFLWLKLTAISR